MAPEPSGKRDRSAIAEIKFRSEPVLRLDDDLKTMISLERLTEG